MKKTMRKVKDALLKLGLPREAAGMDLRLTFDCPVAWEEMAETSEPALRRCGACDADVYDLRDRSREEVVALLRANQGRLCGQVFAREDGRVAFGSCAEDNRQVRGGLTLS